MVWHVVTAAGSGQDRGSGGRGKTPADVRGDQDEGPEGWRWLPGLREDMTVLGTRATREACPRGGAARSRPESTRCKHGRQLCCGSYGHWKDRRIWACPGGRWGQSEGLSRCSGPGAAPMTLGTSLTLCLERRRFDQDRHGGPVFRPAHSQRQRPLRRTLVSCSSPQDPCVEETRSSRKGRAPCFDAPSRTAAFPPVKPAPNVRQQRPPVESAFPQPRRCQAHFPSHVGYYFPSRKPFCWDRAHLLTG